MKCGSSDIASQQFMFIENTMNSVDSNEFNYDQGHD